MRAVLILSLVLLAASGLNANEMDLYEYIDRLADSLDIWTLHPPQLVLVASDTVALDNYFPGATIIMDTVDQVQTITLPIYLGLLTTELTRHVTEADSGGQCITWDVPVELRGGDVFIDRVPVQVDSGSFPDSTLVEMIRKQMVGLRTLGLPEYMVEPQHVCTGEVTVFLRGRDNREFQFSCQNWTRVLHALCYQRQVYAGVLSLFVAEEARLRFYLLVHDPQAQGHHFLEWETEAVRSENTWSFTSQSVYWTAFIRTDNLKSLLGKTRSAPVDRLDMRIK